VQLQDEREVDVGEEEREHLLYNAYSGATKATYATGWRAWAKFATREGRNPTDASQATQRCMTRWVATLAAKNHNTASTYLSAVHNTLRRKGVAHETCERRERQLMIDASKRSRQGHIGKQGIYAEDLEDELDALDYDTSSEHNQYVSLAAAILALCAGLRAMDYAPTKAAASAEAYEGPGGVCIPPPRPLRRKDLAFGERRGVRYVIVSLERSKWWNESVQFTLHETSSKVDVYRWLRWAWRSTMHLGEEGPVFDQGMGRPTYSADISRLCKRIKMRRDGGRTNLTPHSLRVGAARSLSLAGVPRKALNGYMRWKSDAGEIYLKTTPQDFDRVMTPPEGRRRATELILGARVVSQW
jgi:hypothetical protein